MISTTRLEVWAGRRDPGKYPDDNAAMDDLAQLIDAFEELISRRGQDEVVGKLWEVAEWAANQECDYQHIQRRRCQYKPPCGSCLARTLQAKRKELTS